MFGNQISIQFQDVNGNWLTTQLTDVNHSTYIRSLLDRTRMSNPHKRVRAIDSKGNIIDIMS